MGLIRAALEPTALQPKQFLEEFPFESIADHKAFRDSHNGLLYLLCIVHISGDENLTRILLENLRKTFGSIEENKRIISSILEDPEVLLLFLLEFCVCCVCVCKSVILFETGGWKVLQCRGWTVPRMVLLARDGTEEERN
jgi:hypothetical protein